MQDIPIGMRADAPGRYEPIGTKPPLGCALNDGYAGCVYPLEYVREIDGFAVVPSLPYSVMLPRTDRSVRGLYPFGSVECAS